MKKNLPAKLLVLAVMATLITTTLVSGTFAKYVKEVTGSDTVRVAKFAFDLKKGATKFADQSATATQTIDVFSTTDTGLYNSGVGDDGKKIIAPGTTGSFELKVDNLSEVAVAVSFALAETNTNKIPVYYTIGSDTQRYSAALTDTYTGGTYKDIDALASALSGFNLAASSGTLAESDSTKLNWTWAFETAGTGQTDSIDTALGVTGTAEILLGITTTVTQLDIYTAP